MSELSPLARRMLEADTVPMPAREQLAQPTMDAAEPATVLDVHTVSPEVATMPLPSEGATVPMPGQYNYRERDARGRVAEAPIGGEATTEMMPERGALREQVVATNDPDREMAEMWSLPRLERAADAVSATTESRLARLGQGIKEWFGFGNKPDTAKQLNRVGGTAFWGTKLVLVGALALATVRGGKTMERGDAAPAIGGDLSAEQVPMDAAPVNPVPTVETAPQVEAAPQAPTVEYAAPVEMNADVPELARAVMADLDYARVEGEAAAKRRADREAAMAHTAAKVEKFQQDFPDDYARAFADSLSPQRAIEKDAALKAAAEAKAADQAARRAELSAAAQRIQGNMADRQMPIANLNEVPADQREDVAFQAAIDNPANWQNNADAGARAAYEAEQDFLRRKGEETRMAASRPLQDATIGDLPRVGGGSVDISADVPPVRPRQILPDEFQRASRQAPEQLADAGVDMEEDTVVTPMTPQQRMAAIQAQREAIAKKKAERAQVQQLVQNIDQAFEDSEIN